MKCGCHFASTQMKHNDIKWKQEDDFTIVHKMRHKSLCLPFFARFFYQKPVCRVSELNYIMSCQSRELHEKNELLLGLLFFRVK